MWSAGKNGICNASFSLFASFIVSILMYTYLKHLLQIGMAIRNMLREDPTVHVHEKLMENLTQIFTYRAFMFD